MEEEHYSPDPPFETTYENLLNYNNYMTDHPLLDVSVVEEIELPLIDLNKLDLGDYEKQACKNQIARASQEWGFFQVINHGVSSEVLEKMRSEQVKLLKKPFIDKTKYKDLNFSAGSYRWGTPTATCLKQLSCLTMEQFGAIVSELAQKLADILAEEMGKESGFFKETCLPKTCYLRLNRYPACPIYPQMLGIIPHTDSDFLTVVHQDDIGGLQLVKDGRWIAVKPNPKALIINIGDLFQAWSNDVYKSVEHRVVANAHKERFSTAYFYCPSYDTVIKSGVHEPGVYTSFSFGEYRKRVEEDVRIFGNKTGLSRFIGCKEEKYPSGIKSPGARRRTPETESLATQFAAFGGCAAHAAVSNGDLMMNLRDGGVIGGPHSHYHWLFRHAGSM
ncbi:hypothetical protein BUALT_Bualt03G0072400 [Buddleja alternifolia]|uniref:Fe2OG dioxygenase domain-containing protein n=1 Tax=Buddleja alternifolia TaxID=168488 RepID=A0AAV6XW32_9LAMI|nr:hypothetical protein BUALT_Bualt03G0072400 [Buddleja alternifolia]